MAVLCVTLHPLIQLLRQEVGRAVTEAPVRPVPVPTKAPFEPVSPTKAPFEPVTPTRAPSRY